MRILTLSNSPLDAGFGSGYVICGYTEGLRRLGHEVELLGPPEHEWLYGLRRGIGYRQAIGMARAVRRRLGERPWDVIEIYGGEGWLAFSLLAAEWQGPGRRPLRVAHSNGIEPHCLEVLRRAGDPYPRRWWQLDPARLYERTFRAADAIVTVSPWDADYARAQGYAPEGRILALENPLPDDYLDLPLELERPKEIGFAGSWIPRKGVERIARELPGVLRRHPDWRLTLVGVGEGFRPGDRFPADVLPQIAVVPRAARGGELRDLYQRFSILLLPSLYESFGLVAAEGMACGAALVATPVGFAAGLRHGEEALLVEPEARGGAPAREEGALAAALERLIGDEPLRRRIAAGGHARVQGLRWETAARRLAAAYEHWSAEVRPRTGNLPGPGPVPC